MILILVKPKMAVDIVSVRRSRVNNGDLIFTIVKTEKAYFNTIFRVLGIG